MAYEKKVVKEEPKVEEVKVVKEVKADELVANKKVGDIKVNPTIG